MKFTAIQLVCRNIKIKTMDAPIIMILVLKNIDNYQYMFAIVIKSIK